MNIIPLNLGYFFESLEAFYCAECNLFYLDSMDLKQFPGLKILWLPKNRITHLPGDLLKDNPELEFLGLENNPIKKIGAKFFSHSPKLMRFNFQPTECFKATDNDKVEEKIRKVSIECMHKYVPNILSPVLERRQNIPLPTSVILECEAKYIMVEDVERERLDIDGNNQVIGRMVLNQMNSSTEPTDS
jgi:hypothetical protein